MDNKEIFARNFRKQMELHDKTRQDVSNALGIGYSTVASWANGTKYPRMDKVEQIAKYLNISISDLVEGRKEQPTVDNDGLPKSKKAMYEFLDTLSEDQISRLLQIAQAAFEK